MFFTENTNNGYIIYSYHDQYNGEHYSNDIVSTILLSLSEKKSKTLFSNYYQDQDDYGITGKHINSIHYLLVWHNKKNNNYYVLQFTDDIIIENIFYNKEDLYYLKYHVENGFIYNKEDDKLKISYLCILGIYKVSIIDLYEKQTIKSINYDYYSLKNNIIQWNNKYIIATHGYSDEKKLSIIIIDLENEKVIEKIKGERTYKIDYIKKINHPKYGESLLTHEKCGNTFILWIA